MRRFVNEHPLESLTAIVGVVVTALGIALSRQTNWVGLAGTILGIVGATLAAVVSASVFGAQRADEYVLRNLALVRNHLATSSSQISAALSGHLFGGDSIETTLARVDQGVGGISSLIRDLGDMLGSEALNVETEAIIQSKRDVVELGQALDTLKTQVSMTPAAPSPESADSSDILAAIEAMQARVSETIASLTRAEASTPQSRDLVREIVKCPYCRAENHISLGSLVGDTATPACANCAERFYAHRGQTGVFANPMATNVIGSLLTRYKMRMPARTERRKYLKIIESGYKDRKLATAYDVTNILDHELGHAIPMSVRMPLFYGLVNREYGLIGLEQDSTKAMRDLKVEVAGADHVSDFADQAESAWLAQALFRLWGHHLPDDELATYFFGHATLSPEEDAILSRARTFAAAAIDARGVGEDGAAA